MIINSEIILRSEQIDGRVYIIERHTDDAGVEHQVQYLGEEGVDYDKKMTERVPELEAQLQEEARERQERELFNSANNKIEAHVKSLDLKADIGLTDAEVLAYETVKVQDGALDAEVIDG